MRNLIVYCIIGVIGYFMFVQIGQKQNGLSDFNPPVSIGQVTEISVLGVEKYYSANKVYEYFIHTNNGTINIDAVKDIFNGGNADIYKDIQKNYIGGSCKIRFEESFFWNYRINEIISCTKPVNENVQDIPN